MNHLQITCVCAMLGAGLINGAMAQDIGTIDPDVVDVSLVKLLCEPSAYDLKKIRVIGVCLWHFEGAYLFLSRDHFEAFDTESAIELALLKNAIPADLEKLSSLDGQLVAVEGTFRTAKDAPHAIIGPITRVFVVGKKRVD